MNDVNGLWKQRVAQYSKEVRRYLRYMLNDHLLIAVIFASGGAAFYYKQWVDRLDPDFPAMLLISIILAAAATGSPVRTLLKQADLVFLVPMETRLKPYFQRAFMFSLAFQSYVLIILIAILSPLYLKAAGKGASALIWLFIALLALKIWNMLQTWNIGYFVERSASIADAAVRAVLNFCFIYFLVKGNAPLFVFLIGAIMLLYFYYFYKSTYRKGLKWEQLIDLESRRMMTFYRLANLFTDVPKLKERVKRRKWLDWALSFIGYSKDSAFLNLYTRSFLRSSDYLGIFVRLLLIGFLVLYLVPSFYGKLVVVPLFIYLTGFQLLTLWKQHNNKLWIDLYPISEAVREKAFLKLLFVLLTVDAVILSLFVLYFSGLEAAGASAGIGIAFAYLFVYFYAKGKLKKFS